MPSKPTGVKTVGILSPSKAGSSKITEKVKVSWNQPLDGGAPITAYSIKIKTSETTTSYFELDQCDGTDPTVVTVRECSIPISVLIKEPFNLIWGSKVVAHITAFNVIGESKASIAGDAVIYSVPDAPRYINSDPSYTNANRIGITWSDGVSTGGYQIVDYEV